MGLGSLNSVVGRVGRSTPQCFRHDRRNSAANSVKVELSIDRDSGAREGAIATAEGLALAVVMTGDDAVTPS
jgi:hypothetical protein